MPMNRARYPENWEAIATEVKKKANWHCEECGKPCLRPDEPWSDFCHRLLKEGNTGWYQQTYDEIYDEETGEWGDVEKKNRFRLTTAHVNHDPENPNAELKALCAPCHLRYDRDLHKKNASGARYRKRESKGQLSLEIKF